MNVFLLRSYCLSTQICLGDIRLYLSWKKERAKVVQDVYYLFSFNNSLKLAFVLPLNVRVTVAEIIVLQFFLGLQECKSTCVRM